VVVLQWLDDGITGDNAEVGLWYSNNGTLADGGTGVIPWLEAA
jgi:hypothetical protein